MTGQSAEVRAAPSVRQPDHWHEPHGRDHLGEDLLTFLTPPQRLGGCAPR